MGKSPEMNQAASQMAVLANLAEFDHEGTVRYIEGAPHLKHPRLRALYVSLVLRAFNTAKQFTHVPRVLDIGAGEGSATLPFLELGASVTAVDISESQLAALVERCSRFRDRLEVRHEDFSETLRCKEDRYDVVVMNSFLHHVPDYMGLIHEAILVLRPNGLFFSF